MLTEDQQHVDTSQLLTDIYYINQANKDEIKRIREQIRSVIAEADLADKVTTSIVDEVTVMLGRLSTRVKLTEKAIRSMRAGQIPKPKSSPVENHNDSKVTGFKIGIEKLTPNPNLLPIQPSNDGSAYIWSGSDPETQFALELDRSNTLGMQIGLHALIKPEYSKQLKIFIDGKHIKHRFRADKGSFLLSCNLPRSTKAGKTEIKIALPATHSPKDLGISDDYRKLGIAINELRFGEPENVLAHLLKRLIPSK